MMNYLATLLLAAKSILIGCPFDKTNCPDCNDFKYEIERIGQLPEEVKESSGMAVFEDLFITHPDSGNPPKLWGVKYPFKNDNAVHGTLTLPSNIKNIDWEDLAQDDQDNLFIGDFGNNNHERKNLSIIKFNLLTNKSENIEFHYPDQTTFPPKKNKDKNYDCEAMFWSKGKLYLFSKNKGNKNVKVYKLPDQAGSYEAEIIDTLKLPMQITGADISPDGQFATLLSYGKVLLYCVEFDSEEKLNLSPFHCKQFTRSGQSEAIVFLDEENLLITNEKGKVYWMYIKKDRRKREKRNPEVDELFPNMDDQKLEQIN